MRNLHRPSRAAYPPVDPSVVASRVAFAPRGGAAAGRVTRRGVLWKGAGAALAVTALPGCDLLSTDPTEGDRPGSGAGNRGGGPGGAKEAPMLAKRVRADDLPPVEKRVPADPLVLKPLKRSGVYGGEWNAAIVDTDRPEASLNLYVGYDQLIEWNTEFTDIVPNIAESIESAKGGREYVLPLRRGIRWSDGKEFDADDVVFAYDDAMRDVVGVIPTTLQVDDQPPKVEKVDRFTVKFVYPKPHGLFLKRMATYTGGPFTEYPKHYLKKFHKKYNPDVDKLAKRAGFSDWKEMFLAKADRWSNVDIPVLTAWMITKPPGKGTRVIVERNPYYWKTDLDGRQLPYIDRVVFDMINTETLVLKASHGELDLQTRYLATNLAAKPVLAQGRKKGGYRFLDMKSVSANYTVIMLNLNHQDPALREVFGNRDFRIGLSHAINRPEIIEAIFQRQGKPWQAAPRPESPYFDEALAQQYLDYDVDKANAHLDKAGITKRDGDGFRLRRDGKRISFQIELSGQFPFWLETVERVRHYWQAVGIEMRAKTEDAKLFYTRKAANKHDATVWRDLAGRRGPVLDPRFYFPYGGESNYAVLWANWFLGTEPNEKPPPETRRQMDLYRKLKTTPGDAEQKKIFAEILSIAREQFYTIGTVMPTGDYGIVKNNVHNVYEPMPNAYLYRTPGSARPEQFFIEQS